MSEDASASLAKFYTWFVPLEEAKTPLVSQIDSMPHPKTPSAQLCMTVFFVRKRTIPKTAKGVTLNNENVSYPCTMTQFLKKRNDR